MSVRPEQPSLHRLYRLRDLSQFVGLRRTQIAELIAAGKFPKPILLNDTGRAKAWLEADLIAWQNGRIAARNQGEGVSESPKPFAADKQKAAVVRDDATSQPSTIFEKRAR